MSRPADATDSVKDVEMGGAITSAPLADHGSSNATSIERPVDEAADRYPASSHDPSIASGLPSGPRPAGPQSLWRSVALPSEHGGWGLTGEPVLLGLLIKPSIAGLALGLAAMVAFVARTPLKVVLVDRWRGRVLDRTLLAARIAAAEIAVFVGLLAFGVVRGGNWCWVPLALALPAIAVELWFDMRSRSRRLVPELAGTIGIGSVAAAVVLAGGGSTKVAIGAWLVVAARAVASLPFVRLQLRRGRGQAHRRWASDLAQAVAGVVGVIAAVRGFLSPTAAVALCILALMHFALARVSPPKAVVVGMQQLFLGLAVVIAAGLTMS